MNPDARLSPNAELITKVISFLVTHYMELLLLDDVANHVGVSSFYINPLIKKETAETPRSFLEKIRVDKAAYLLSRILKFTLPKNLVLRSAWCF
jgi:AraC family transcriptional regulator of adaptative response / methylphosphotriester-DNA alkyltransferase methyltransferase